MQLCLCNTEVSVSVLFLFAVPLCEAAGCVGCVRGYVKLTARIKDHLNRPAFR